MGAGATLAPVVGSGWIFEFWKKLLSRQRAIA
jgi:hypothetical protein